MAQELVHSLDHSLGHAMSSVFRFMLADKNDDSKDLGIMRNWGQSTGQSGFHKSCKVCGIYMEQQDNPSNSSLELTTASMLMVPHLVKARLPLSFVLYLC